MENLENDLICGRKVLLWVCHRQRFHRSLHTWSYSGEGSEPAASGRLALSRGWTMWPLDDPFNLHGAMILWCLKVHGIEIIKITIKFVFRILRISVRAFHNSGKTYKHTFGLWNLNNIIDYFTGLIYSALNEAWV